MSNPRKVLHIDLVVDTEKLKSSTEKVTSYFKEHPDEVWEEDYELFLEHAVIADYVFQYLIDPTAPHVTVNTFRFFELLDIMDKGKTTYSVNCFTMLYVASRFHELDDLIHLTQCLKIDLVKFYDGDYLSSTHPDGVDFDFSDSEIVEAYELGWTIEDIEEASSINSDEIRNILTDNEVDLSDYDDDIV